MDDDPGSLGYILVDFILPFGRVLPNPGTGGFNLVCFSGL